MNEADEFLALRTVLLPRDTNGAGTIFGGVILSQIDLAGAVVARNYACHRYVTVAMKEVKFLAPVYVGDEVSYWGRVLSVGNTSIAVRVRVEAERYHDCETTAQVTSADVVYVAVASKGRPVPVASTPETIQPR